MDRAVISRDAARDELSAMLRSIVSKDAAALKTLYERTSAKLYGICLSLLRDEAEAQDVVQELYVTVWNKAALFDPGKASPITWLATLARNRSIDRLRSRRGAGAAEELDSALAVPDERPSSFEVLEQAEERERLRHCLEELEEGTRSAIRAAFFEGATYPQLAEQSGVPLPTMKSRIRRGLMRLRGCLGQ